MNNHKTCQSHDFLYSRPTSALSFPHSDTYTPIRSLVPPGNLNTSAASATSNKSVFECEMGCFVDLDDDSSSIHSATCPNNPANNGSIHSTSDVKDV